MAIWNTGVTWAPPVDMLNSDLTSSLQHVATHFAQWTRHLARATFLHKRNPATMDAMQRSGCWRGHNGLTDQQWYDREEKRTATRDYYYAIDLDAEDQSAKGFRKYQPKSTSKKRDRQGRSAAEHLHRPRHVEKMSDHEQWLVYSYRNGTQRLAFLFVTNSILCIRLCIEIKERLK